MSDKYNIQAGSIRYRDLLPDERIPEGYIRKTSRYNKRKDGSYSVEYEIFIPSKGKIAIVNVIQKDRNAYELGNLLSLILSNNILEKIYIAAYTNESPEEEKLTIAQAYKKLDVFADDGPYIRKRILRGLPVDHREIKATRKIMARIMKIAGGSFFEDWENETFLQNFVEKLRYEGRVGRTRACEKKTMKALSPQTVKNMLNCLSSFFSIAIDNKMCTTNPVPRMRQMLPPKSFSDSFSIIPENIEIKILISLPESVDFISFSMIICLAFTGARIGELMALRISDVALDSDCPTMTIRSTLKKDGTISDTTKTRTFRIVPLGKLAVQALRPLVNKGGEFVFSIDGLIIV